MPEVSYGTGAYRRRVGALPELVMRNMLVESARTGRGGISIQSRPGLAELATVGAGPVKALSESDSAIGGKRITVSGSSVYAGATYLGAITGTDIPSIAASEFEVLICAGKSLYTTDGTTLATVSLPDNFDCAAVGFIGSRFVAVKKATQRFYWSDPLDGSTWDALNFASSESSPDGLVDIAIVREELWLLGKNTIEPWQVTGDVDLPFTPSLGRVYLGGVYGVGCSAVFDNTLHTIGDDRLAKRYAQVPEIISDEGMAERLANSTIETAFWFQWQGHKFFAVRLSDVTMIFDVATREWFEASSVGRSNWRARCANTINGVSTFGDDETGKLFTLGGNLDAGEEVERRFTVALPIDDAGAPIDNLQLFCSVGNAAIGITPLVEMRTSRDAGRTWSSWRAKQLGLVGQYRKRVKWNRLGVFDHPGMMAEIRCTSDVEFRVSGVTVNDPGGGRGRP